MVDPAVGRRALTKSLATKSCLIVLDDVWDYQHVAAFNVTSINSRLLVTTRDAHILTALGAREHRVDRLDRQQGLQLLINWSGITNDILPHEALPILEECGHLPLAIKAVGANIRDGIGWSDALTQLRAGALEYFDHPAASVFASLRLGVDHLDFKARERYLETAVFAEDELIPEETVCRFWLYSGGLSGVEARRLLSRLERKCLLDLTTRGSDRFVSFHDLQHDFVRLEAIDVHSLHGLLLDAHRPVTTGLLGATDTPWHLLPRDEPYMWTHLARHHVDAGRTAALLCILLDTQWQEEKLRTTGVVELLSDFGYVGGDQTCQRVREAIELSASVLAADPSEIHGQLWGRLASDPDPRIQAMLAHAVDRVELPWLRPTRASLAAPDGRLTRTLFHPKTIRAVALAADGGTVATGCGDGSIKVWDLEHGVLVRDLRAQASPVTTVAVSENGSVMLSGGEDGIVRVWDRDLRNAVHELSQCARSSVLALSLDGQTAVAEAFDHRIVVLDVRTGNVRRYLRHDTPQLTSVKSMSVTAHGDRLATVTADGLLRIWETDTGVHITADLAGLWPRTVTLTANGTHAAVGCDTEASLLCGTLYDVD